MAGPSNEDASTAVPAKEHEGSVLDSDKPQASGKGKKQKVPTVAFKELFRYITRCEVALNAVAYIAAVANGAIMPVSGTVLFRYPPFSILAVLLFAALFPWLCMIVLRAFVRRDVERL
jgi:hypothetical protein